MRPCLRGVTVTSRRRSRTFARVYVRRPGTVAFAGRPCDAASGSPPIRVCRVHAACKWSSAGPYDRERESGWSDPPVPRTRLPGRATLRKLFGNRRLKKVTEKKKRFLTLVIIVDRLCSRVHRNTGLYSPVPHGSFCSTSTFRRNPVVFLNFDVSWQLVLSHRYFSSVPSCSRPNVSVRPNGSRLNARCPEEKNSGDPGASNVLGCERVRTKILDGSHFSIFFY